MVGLGAFTDCGFLGFDEVAEVDSLADAAFWTETRVGAQGCVVGNLGAVEDATVEDGDAVADGGVGDDGVGADAGVGADDVLPRSWT